MEGSLVAYKVFTNGSTLQASELNENLMQQSVAVFSNSAARTAAITSPLEGMLTWLEDVNRYESYTGTAWVPAFGLTHINTTSFTTQTTVNIDNVFSAAFDNYKIIFNVASTSANTVQLAIRARAGGTTNTNNEYQAGELTIGVASSLAFASSNNSTQNYVTGGNSSSAAGLMSEVNVFRPFLTQRTGFFSNALGNWMGVSASLMTVTTSYDGFSFNFSSGTMTGNVRIFGIRNA
jgi:hypothetical protein